MEFKSRDFVKEMAYRTKINYYTFRSLNTCEEEKILDGVDTVEKRKLVAYKEGVKERLEETKKQMYAADFGVDNYFEVTLLINSLMGLLVFPEQRYYDEVDKSIQQNDFSNFSELHKCMKIKGQYYSSYQEVETPIAVIRHMRNALAHKKVMLFPHSIDKSQKEKDNKITHVMFQDCDHRNTGSQDKKNDGLQNHIFMNGMNPKDLRDLPTDFKRGHSVFCLIIPVEQLEDVVIGICDSIIPK